MNDEEAQTRSSATGDANGVSTVALAPLIPPAAVGDPKPGLLSINQSIHQPNEMEKINSGYVGTYDRDGVVRLRLRLRARV
jgi:hypothetical protein